MIPSTEAFAPAPTGRPSTRTGSRPFLTADDREQLLTREKPDYDGAEPAGNSVALLNLLRLAELTSDDRYRERADAVARAFAPILTRSPQALPHMLGGLDFQLGPVKEIVLVSPGERSRVQPFVERLAGSFIPTHVLVVIADGAPSAALARLVPLVAEKTPIGGQPTAYVCERRVCKLPVTDVPAFARQLEHDASTPSSWIFETPPRIRSRTPPSLG